MGPFWASFFEHIRHCGRNATLFLVTLAAICALIVLGVVLYLSGLYRYVLPVLPFLAVFAAVRFVSLFRRARARRRLRMQLTPLSDIELRRARAKLIKRRS